ncbi:Hypothetical protein R9X50_00613000 [Acrodontium crateriforme]|uniref:Uncharacterized protein n=1 Tax=Acrodontium crateriforme TaxID=150365 RepID=A0AAQ3RDH7_9PEZI|nr:Hypothetical protein R9X50_00613000 [Acrodontium crateriforme]
MSFPTQEVFIHYGSYDDELRSHPVMKWMENYAKNIVDSRQWDKSYSDAGHTDDFTFQKSTGEVVEGGEAAWKAVAEVYSPFSSHFHEPTFVIVWKTDKGYGMFGTAKLHWNLAVPGDKKGQTGYDGKEWDGVTPGAFKFHYDKDGDSFKISRTEIYSDPSAAMVIMMHRGMLKPEDLANM